MAAVQNLYTFFFISCVRLIVIQVWLNTIHLRTKPSLFIFLVINSYISFIEILISEPDKNLRSLNYQYQPQNGWTYFARLD